MAPWHRASVLHVAGSVDNSPSTSGAELRRWFGPRKSRLVAIAGTVRGFDGDCSAAAAVFASKRSTGRNGLVSLHRPG